MSGRPEDASHVTLFLMMRQQVTRPLVAAVLKTMLRVVPDFVPGWYFYEDQRGERQEPFDPNGIDRIMAAWDLERCPFMMFANRLQGHRWDIHLYHMPELDYRPISYDVPLPYVQGHPEMQDRLMALAQELYPICRPFIGYCHEGDHRERIARETKWASLHGIPATIAWLNLWGPEVVEKVGASLIESGDWHRLQRFDDGGYLLQLSPHILDFDDPSVAARRERMLRCFPFDRLRQEVEEKLAAKRAALGIEGPAELVYQVDIDESKGEVRCTPMTEETRRLTPPEDQPATKRRPWWRRRR